MKKLLATFVLTASLLTACNTPVDKNDIADEGGDDYYGPDLSDIGNPQDGPMGTDVEETINEDGSYTFTVLSGGEEVAQIEKEKPVDGYSAYILGDTYLMIYVAINPTGLGGYILYGGAFELSQVDVEAGVVKPVLFEGLATDISRDGTKLATVVSSEAGTAIVVMEIGTGEEEIYSVPNEFDQVGDATFNLDGSKVAYQATITSAEPNVEETAVFVIDLTTGEQTEFDRQEGLYEITWQDNDRPIVE